MNQKTIENTLRQAIQKSGISRFQIAKETGVTEAALSRFVMKGTTLTLTSAQKLADFFGLELVKKKKKGKK